MARIIIVGEDTVNKLYKVVVLDDALTQVVATNVMNEVNVIQMIIQGVTPVNFSVVNNKIIQDNGVFKRFNHGVSPLWF